jgi:hypothetical protein
LSSGNESSDQKNTQLWDSLYNVAHLGRLNDENPARFTNPAGSKGPLTCQKSEFPTKLAGAGCPENSVVAAPIENLASSFEDYDEAIC